MKKGVTKYMKNENSKKTKPIIIYRIRNTTPTHIHICTYVQSAYVCMCSHITGHQKQNLKFSFRIHKTKKDTRRLIKVCT